MKNLIRQLGLGPEYEEGLGGLNVDKIDFYKNENSIKIRLSGVRTEKSERLLDEVRDVMEKKSGCRVEFTGGEPVNAAAPKPSYNPGMDPEILKILEEEEQAKKEKAASKKKESEPGVDKNSWVAKAKEQKEIFDASGTEKPKFRPKKNEDSIVG